MRLVPEPLRGPRQPHQIFPKSGSRHRAKQRTRSRRLRPARPAATPASGRAGRLREEMDTQDVACRDAVRHRRRRAGRPTAPGGRARGVLATAGECAQRRHGCSRRPLGGNPGRYPPAARRFSRRRRGLRPGVLRHLAARGGRDGSAAASRARARLGGAGGRPRRPGRAGGHPHRRLRGRHRQRLRRAGPPLRSERRHPAHSDRAGPRHHRQPAVLPAGPARPEPDGGHRPVVVAGGGAPGLREPALGRVGAGAGRRRPPQSHRRDGCQRAALRRAVPGRAVLHLRRAGERLRARRGRRGRRAQAARGRARRRRPDPRGDPRQRGQQRRRHGGPDRPERTGPAGRGARGGQPRRRRPARRALRRAARHRHRGRGPDRGVRAGRRLRCRPARRRPPAGRVGEDEHRPSRGRRGDHRPGQDGPRDHAPGAPAEPELRHAQPPDPVRGTAAARGDRPAALAARRPAAAGRGELVGSRRDELPRRAGRGAQRTAHGGRGGRGSWGSWSGRRIRGGRSLVGPAGARRRRS